MTPLQTSAAARLSRSHPHRLPLDAARPSLPAPLESERGQTRRRERAWSQLFASLCLGAGNGIGLTAALVALYGWPNLRELGGPKTALVVLWFASSLPLAALAYGLRERLMRSSAVVPIAHVASLLTVAAFALYLFKIVRG